MLNRLNDMQEMQENFATCCLRLLAAGVACVTLSACSSGPSRVEAPDIDAGAAGDLAMEMYDTNGDGVVAGEELESAPSLKAALRMLDQSGDGGVSAEEVTARIQVWQGSRTGITSIPCNVLLDGQPLAGAEITLEPEAFLGGELKAAVGTTNRFGRISPSVPKEDRPSPDTPAGLPFGLYKVRISKQVGGREMLPPKYNTETTLGKEVSFDDPATLENRVIFDLKTR